MGEQIRVLREAQLSSRGDDDRMRRRAMMPVDGRMLGTQRNRRKDGGKAIQFKHREFSGHEDTREMTRRLRMNSFLIAAESD